MQEKDLSDYNCNGRNSTINLDMIFTVVLTICCLCKCRLMYNRSIPSLNRE